MGRARLDAVEIVGARIDERGHPRVERFEPHGLPSTGREAHAPHRCAVLRLWARLRARAVPVPVPVRRATLCRESRLCQPARIESALIEDRR
jgi:hypothetical protein